nr:hypothetical protein Hi04_10k_c5016_00009 [uncultured bacterium]
MQTQLDAHMVGEIRQTASVALALRKQNVILSALAMLSDREIKMMNRQDLLDALRMAQSASLWSEMQNVDNMDAAELRRVLAIVRDHFRKADPPSSAKGWTPEFN